MKKCIICGSSKFKINSDKFCSQECIHKYGNIQRGNKMIKCEICGNEIRKCNYKKHLKSHQTNHYFCEYCGKEVFEKYGSGRFCSSKCAKGFSTKAKRKEINKKVSNALFKDKNLQVKYIQKKNLTRIYEKICPVCNLKFKTKSKKRQCCSDKCSHEYGASKVRGTHHIVKDTSNMGGLRPGGGKSKQISYTNWLGYKMSLNKEEIEVAKVFDKKKLKWNRNRKGFLYLTQEGKRRKYYPDFIINENEYVEYKGWVTSEMEWKMKNAKEDNNLNLTIIVGNDKRYKDFGISLEDYIHNI